MHLIFNDTKDEISKKQPANELPDDEFSFLRKKKALAATSSDESQNQKSPTAGMENYLCDASSSPVGVKWSPLHYWKIRESMFPRLGKLARRVFYATATTANVERIFSTAGFIVSCRRARIGDNLFESLLFNNLNSDLRVFSGTMEKFTSEREQKLPENETE